MRHNLRDLTVNLLTEICKVVDIEPQILLVTDESFNNRKTNTSNEARVDQGAFLMRWKQELFDVRIFEPNANWYLNKTLRQYYIQNEKEKKQQHNERILELNHGNFTRLEFSIYMSMAREFSTFCNRLAIEITENYKNYINQLFQIGYNQKYLCITEFGTTMFTWIKEPY